MILLRIAVAGLTLAALQSLLEKLLAIQRAAPALALLLSIVLANLLTAAILIYAAARLQAAGLRLATILFLFSYGIHFNNLVEAIFFQLDIPRQHLPRLFVSSLLVAVLFAPSVVWIAGKWKAKPQTQPDPRAERTKLGWVSRILVCDVAYLVLYLVAGILTFPYVRDFYAQRALPSLSQIVPMQLFRGLVFIALSLLIIERMRKRRWEVAVFLGLAFSVLGGIAPLLTPNPYLPAPIRQAHLWEVGISNFVFGCILGAPLGRVRKV